MIHYTASLILLLSLSAQAEIHVYKIERVISPRSDTYGEKLHGLAIPQAQFEIGAVKKNERLVPIPDRSNFEHMLLVGTNGLTVKTSFVELEKVCEYLCGDEIEECHYTGLLSWDGEDIGVPLLAVTGLLGEVSDFLSYIDTKASKMPDLTIPEQALIWPEENFLDITASNSESRFLIRYGVDKPYRYTQEGKQCRLFDYKGTGLLRLSCNVIEALLDGETPLFFSDADYNLPNTQLVNLFKIDGQVYYTVMLALKAYTAYGLLTKENGQWRFIVKTADWAGLC